MNRYEVIGTMLDKKLTANYTVTAIYFPKDPNERTQELREFGVFLQIYRNDIDDPLWVNKNNPVYIKDTIKHIRSAISQMIEEKLIDGFFKPYIEQYEYQQKAFDIGNTLLEEERLNKLKNGGAA